MISDTNIKEQEQKTASLSRQEENLEFNWKQCWYPVTFVQDLPKNRPLGFSLYDEPFVLFRNQDGQLGCLTDRCIAIGIAAVAMLIDEPASHKLVAVSAFLVVVTLAFVAQIFKTKFERSYERH